MSKIITHSAEETESFGRELAEKLAESSKKYFIALYGDLGAGKTAFVRGLASVLSPGSRVKSPTYTIVNEYRRGKIPLFHFDLYRISDEDELSDIGFEEYLENGICVAEWSENLSELMPKDAVKIKITKLSDNEREIEYEDIK